MAFSISTIYISFSLLLCGFYIRVSDMELSVVRALTWASFSKYAFNAMATVELKDRVWTDFSCPLPTEGESKPLAEAALSSIIGAASHTAQS